MRLLILLTLLIVPKAFACRDELTASVSPYARLKIVAATPAGSEVMAKWELAADDAVELVGTGEITGVRIGRIRMSEEDMSVMPYDLGGGLTNPLDGRGVEGPTHFVSMMVRGAYVGLIVPVYYGELPAGLTLWIVDGLNPEKKLIELRSY